MKRIGIAASHVAKDNVLFYNMYVVLLSCLFSFLIFLLSGIAVIAGFAIFSLIAKGVIVFETGAGLSSVFTICMGALAVVVGVINLIAILMNIRLK